VEALKFGEIERALNSASSSSPVGRKIEFEGEEANDSLNVGPKPSKVLLEKPRIGVDGAGSGPMISKMGFVLLVRAPRNSGSVPSCLHRGSVSNLGRNGGPDEDSGEVTQGRSMVTVFMLGDPMASPLQRHDVQP
jgi:hypothetical protein